LSQNFKVILGIVPKFQGKMGSCSKVMNKKVEGGEGHNGPPPILNRVKAEKALTCGP